LPLRKLCRPLVPEGAGIARYEAQFIAGWLAGKIIRGNGFGLVGDATIGIVGALIGDWLLHRLGVHFGSGIIGLVINATIGAIVLLLPLRLMGASGWGSR